MHNRLFMLLLAVAFLLTAPSAASAEERLLEFSWKTLNQKGELEAGQYLPPDALPETPFGALKIANSAGNPLTVKLLEIAQPAVTTRLYAIKGQVRYEGVAGKGYLEMLNYFKGGQYFTKTLAETGPMQFFSGNSGWRPVALPFSFSEASDSPEKIVLHLVLPGAGTVYISDLALFQYKQGETPLAPATSGAWWNARTAGYIGGFAGGFIGLLGALIGFLTARGRSKGFVMAALNAMLVIGAAALVIGGFAVMQAQPYAVFYPLLLLGGICTALALVLRKPLKLAYQNREMRKLQSMDMQ